VFYLKCADWKRLGCGARGICRKFNIWKKDVNTIHFLGRVLAEEHHNHMLSPEAFLDRRFMDNPDLPIKTHYRSVARRWTYLDPPSLDRIRSSLDKLRSANVPKVPDNVNAR
jgi:hypothetical protein